MKAVNRIILDACTELGLTFSNVITNEVVKLAIRNAQKEAYNQALEDAAGETYPLSDNLMDFVHNNEIKRSILKLRK